MPFLFLLSDKMLQTTLDQRQTDSETIAWIVTFAVVGVLAIVINLLTLYTFFSTTALRTRKHVMIISLAGADFLFGVAGIPIYMIFLLRPTITCYYALVIVHRFCKAGSLLTICIIAVERMHAIVWPLRHKTLPSLVFKIAIAFIWICAAVIALSGLNLMFRTFSYTLYRFISAVLTPAMTIGVVFVIVSCYVTIWVSFRGRKRRRIAVSTNHDKTLAITLLLVSGAFLVTWAPPMLYLSIIQVCKSCIQLNVKTLDWIIFIFGIQCLVNPIIYCYRLPLFKVSMKAVVKRMFPSCFQSSCNMLPRESAVHPERQKAHELQEQPAEVN